MIRAWAGTMAAVAVLTGASGADAATPAELVAACNLERGFGFAFDQGPAQGAQVLDNTLYFVPVDRAFAPFGDAELEYTPQSQKLRAVTVMARFASGKAAGGILEDILAAVESDSRFPVPQNNFPAPAIDEGFTFATEWTTDKMPAGLVFVIYRIGPQVYLSCRSDEAKRQEESSSPAPSSL